VESKEGPEGRWGHALGVQVKSVSSVERVVCAVRRVVRRAPAAARAQWRRDGILYRHTATGTSAHAASAIAHAPPGVLWGEISESSHYVRAYLYLSPRYTIDQ
jgi:hypothetical protein